MWCILLLTLVFSDSTCRFERATDDVFVLKFKDWSAKLEVFERDAKLASWKTWPKFPNLLVAEVDSGTAGTSAKVRQLHLYVFDLRKTDAKPLLKEKIGEVMRVRDPKTGEESIHKWQNSYQLKTSAESKPAVSFGKSKVLKIIQY
jgi:hypothetical protein